MKKLLFLTCFVLMLFSCNSNQKQKDTLKDTKAKVIDLTGREDLCSLLDEQTVRTVFKVPDSIEFKTKDDKSICSYSWTLENEKTAFYKISLNFANKVPKSQEALTSIWDSQNKSLYNKKEREMESIDNLGDAASWSNLGGGQLRVHAAGYIFYISLSAQELQPKGVLKSNMPKNEMIEKASLLAQNIIKKLE